MTPVTNPTVNPNSEPREKLTLPPSRAPYRVAIAQISTDPGAIDRNTEKILSSIQEAKDAGADMVVFPELAIPGYCSMDLLWDKDYLAANLAGLQRLKEESTGITVVVGFVDVEPGGALPGGRPKIFNSAAIIRDREILAVQDKTLLPDYDIFSENRYFAPPRGSRVVQAGPIRIGAEICEDLWTKGYSTDPAQKLVDEGAELVVNLSASPFHIGKLPVRLGLVSGTAKEKGVPFVYANLVGSFDGFEREVVFDGRSMVVGQSGTVDVAAQGLDVQVEE